MALLKIYNTLYFQWKFYLIGSLIERFKEFSSYFFVKLRRVRTYCDIILTRENSSVASANYVISKSIDKQKDRGKQYNQLTGNVTNYYRVRVHFIAVISVYLAQILLHTVKTLVTSRARLLSTYIYVSTFHCFLTISTLP